MKVQIEGNLYLESDGMQFILKEYTGKTYEAKDGKQTEAFNTIGYYSSIQSAVKDVLKRKIMESTAKDLKTLLESVDGLKQYIEDRIAV